MTSLLPPPWGKGARSNAAKRNDVRRHLRGIGCRTMACGARERAADVEREIKRLRGDDDRFGI